MFLAGLRIGITFGLLFSIGFTTTCADETQFFRESVEPLLKRRCYECHSHSGSELSGGLVLDWKSGWQKGGDRGPAIIPGDPENSLLIKAIRHSDADLKMPEEKR